MQFHSNLIYLIGFLTLIVGLVSVLRQRAAANSFTLLALSILICFEGAAYLLYQNHQLTLQVLSGVNYLFTGAAAGLHLLLSLHYSKRAKRIVLPTLIALLVMPLLIQIGYWVAALNRTLFQGSLQIGDLVSTFYAVGLLAVSSAIQVEALSRRLRFQNLRREFAIALVVLPLFATLATALRSNVPVGAFVLFASYSLYLIAAAADMFDSRLAESDLITRDEVVEGMDDGWMVVDKDQMIVDLNRATEEMIGLPRERVFGQPIHTILSDWSNMFNTPESIKELDMRRSVKSQSDWRYLNIRVSKLSDSRNVNFGHLIVWRDITKRKMADDARQRARDELFVLLNAISSAASHSMSLEEFLNESIYQIVYSFRSQAVAVYLVDHEIAVNGLSPLALKAHFGIPPEHLETMSDAPLTESILQWLTEGQAKQSTEVVDLHGDDLEAYPIVQTMGFARMAMIPLVVVTRQKSEVFGCICLARSEDIAFSQDEMIRLKTISNQIATLIDSDRRRQYAIAVSERQRLMRDLHDSVSQKLYGLLALTEAAQAALEAGSEIIPTQVLSRIGENARQAVREMRLFLYEMQPVDLDEGLISVLHHRLAAVEGRADIKARLVVDENILLPKDREIALYFISQEALNNILRHAHAKNVSITLKQTRQNVILEVNDDGLGFDMETVDQGGLGLRNMRERTQKMDGKFKIASKPGDGTKISVTLPRKAV